MINFRKEIRDIAKERRGVKEEKSGSVIEGTGTEIKEVMSRFYSLTELGVSIYNESLNDEELSIYRLPEELLALFLNIAGRRVGFCLMAPEKIIVFLSEGPDQVLVLGRKRQQLGTGESILTKARQLIRITYTKSEHGIVFKDNTGSILDPEEVIIHIIKWAVSE